MDKEELYSEYLQNECSDELHTKDQLIDAMSDGLYMEEFAQHVLRSMMYEGRVTQTTIITEDMIEKFLEDM